MHPVTRRIDEAVALLERWQRPVSVHNVIVNAKKKLTYSDFSSDEACDAVLRVRVRSRLRTLGYSIADAETHEQRQLDDCTYSEFCERVKIKRENAQHVERSLEADEAVAEFLAVKREQLGREITVGDFADEIEAIYADFELAPAA